MKPTFVVSCPIDTYSGYGARSRDFVKALVETDKYNVKVMPQQWGRTPWGFINDHKEEWGFLMSLLTPAPLTVQPDIWCQVTVPNEFQPIGKFNIGLTAGIETTKCDPSWVEGCNRMNQVWVSSEHSKQVFVDGGVTTPLSVLMEGVDVDLYTNPDTTFDLDSIEEDYAFLYLGHWLQGQMGEDRKNTALMIRLFLEAFKNQDKAPALILKTTKAGPSYMDRDAILKHIEGIQAQVVGARKLPSIYLLHGDLSEDEMSALYNNPKIKTMVNLTKGEGFGRPLLEFSLTKKPIISTNWSGHIDFLDENFVTLLPGRLTNVHKSAAAKNMILEDSQWFSVDQKSAVDAFQSHYKNYKKYLEGGKRQAHRSKTKFSFEAMVDQLKNYCEEQIPDLTVTLDLNLPNLSL